MAYQTKYSLLRECRLRMFRCISDKDTNTFAVNTRVLQEDTITIFLCIIILDSLLQYAIAFELRPHHSSHHPESILIDLNFVDVNHNHKCSNHLPPTNLLLFAAIQASLSINCPKANSTILGENAGLSDLTFSSGSTKLPISVCSALFFTLAAEMLTLVKQ